MNRTDLFSAIRPFAPNGKFTDEHVKAIDALADSFALARVAVSEGAAKVTGSGDVFDIPQKPNTLRKPAEFFANIKRPFTQGQVDGFNTLLSAMSAWPSSWVAYGLATAWHETNETMQPVAEAYFLGDKAEAWRKKNLRYWPWYGRGYPQTTWEANYLRADKELNLGGSLMANPDRMLEPDIAARTMVLGMAQGWFTGKTLADYLPGDYVGARRIINGTDKADLIAGYARAFEAALKAGEWS